MGHYFHGKILYYISFLHFTQKSTLGTILGTNSELLVEINMAPVPSVTPKVAVLVCQMALSNMCAYQLSDVCSQYTESKVLSLVYLYPWKTQIDL